VIGAALLVIAVIMIVVGIALDVFAPAVAPLGYQDDTGFHVGTPNGAHEDGLAWTNPT
jgi:hypothetical protein